MVLTSDDRGDLEISIDRAIKIVPQLMKITRNPEIKKDFFIKEENDFVYGMLWGLILDNFLEMFLKRRRSFPTENELGEVLMIMLRRSRDIRDAIFNTG